MKLVSSNNSKQKVIISQSEWVATGLAAGWLTHTAEEVSPNAPKDGKPVDEDALWKAKLEAEKAKRAGKNPAGLDGAEVPSHIKNWAGSAHEEELTIHQQPNIDGMPFSEAAKSVLRDASRNPESDKSTHILAANLIGGDVEEFMQTLIHLVNLNPYAETIQFSSADMSQRDVNGVNEVLALVSGSKNSLVLIKGINANNSGAIQAWAQQNESTIKNNRSYVILKG